MKYETIFDEFYAQVYDTVNSSFNLGEKIPNNRIFRKILRSLPQRFRPKMTTLEESNCNTLIPNEKMRNNPPRVGSL
jgi:hypothetical protein